EPDIAAIKNPHHTSSDTSKQSSKQSSTLNSTIYSAISDQYKSFKLGTFKITRAHLRSMQSGDTLALLGHLNLTLNDIKIDSATVQASHRLIIDVVSMKVRRLMVKFSHSLNKITLKKVVISSNSQSLQL